MTIYCLHNNKVQILYVIVYINDFIIYNVFRLLIKEDYEEQTN